MASVIIDQDSPPAYDECCTADDVTLICVDQDADDAAKHQSIQTEQPAPPIGYIGVQGQGHQPYVVPHQPVMPPSAWAHAVQGTFDARSYSTSPTNPRQSSATAIQLTRRTDEPLSSIAPIVDLDGNEVEMFKCQVVFGCIVMWLFNFVFGLVAYALASHAEIIKYAEPRTARTYGIWSIAVSVAGIIFTVVVITVLATSHQWLKLTSDSTLQLHG